MELPQLVDQVEADLDELGTALVGGIWEVLPGYSAEQLSREEFVTVAGAHLRLILAVVREQRRPTTEELQFAVRLGASRALEGVPLPSVLQAYRVAERALLEAVLDRAERFPPQVVVAAVTHLGDVIDDLGRASVQAYQQAQAEITVRYEHLDADLVHDLVASDEVDPADVAERARLVAADPDAPYLGLAVALPAGASGVVGVRARRQLLAEIAAIARRRILTGSWGHTSVLVLPCDVEPERFAAVAERALGRAEDRTGHVVGIGDPVERLSLAGRSCREALAAVEVASRLRWPPSVVRFVDVIPEALLLRDRASSRQLVHARLGRILGNEPLMVTLRAYLEIGLSVRRTAERLHVHENTVSYRLRQVGERTGRDLRRTADVCELHLALTAADLLAAPAPD